MYFAPRFGKHEPKFQVWGNSTLLVALTVVVVGSLVGAWASVQGILGGDNSFWFGHQGYEYVELGRLWQLLLIGGMVFLVILDVSCFKTCFERGRKQNGLKSFFPL